MVQIRQENFINPRVLVEKDAFSGDLNVENKHFFFFASESTSDIFHCFKQTHFLCLPYMSGGAV